MVIFGWVIIVVTLVNAAEPSPPAPYFKNHDLDHLREGIFALASNGVGHIVHHAPASHGTTNAKQLTFPFSRNAAKVQSRTPQVNHHVIIDARQVTPRGGQLQEQRQNIKKHSNSGEKNFAAGASHNTGGKRKSGDVKYRHDGHEKGSKQTSKHYHDSAKRGDSGKEEHKKSYGEDNGHKTSYQKGDKHGQEHHSSGGGGHKAYHKHAANNDQQHYEKGFHDLHHKDEKKKHDSFYENGHEEGKWLKFGKKNHKHGKEGYKKKNGKWEKAGKEGDSYKKGKKDGKEHGSKSHGQHGHKGSEGHSYNNHKEYATEKSTKTGKSYVVKH